MKNRVILAIISLSIILIFFLMKIDLSNSLPAINLLLLIAFLLTAFQFFSSHNSFANLQDDSLDTEEENSIIKHIEKATTESGKMVDLSALGAEYRLNEQMKFEDVIDKMLQTALSIIKQHLESYTVAVFFPTGEDGYKIRKYISDGDNINSDAVIVPGVGVIGGHIKEELKKIDLKEVLSDSKTLYYYKKDAGIRSVLLAPLVADETTRGFIIVDSTKVKRFTDEDYNYLSSMADLLSQSIFYSYLYNQYRLDHERLLAMSNTDNAFFENQNIDSVLDKMVEIIPLAFQCDRLTISLLEESGNGVILKSWGKNSEDLLNLTFDPKAKTLAGILYSKNICFYRSFTQNSYETRYSESEPTTNDFGSFIAHPIGVDSCKGMILIESQYKNAYNDSTKGQLKTLLSTASLAIEKIQLHDQTENMAVRDGLTGLYNHKKFQQNLKTSITRSLRTKAPLSLAICDIDFFKKVNDNYGHSFGDVVLKSVAAKLASSVRDVVDSCARYGGEEFTLILGDSDATKAFETVDRIRQAIESLPFTTPQGDDFHVTMSFGIAVYGEHAKKQELLISRADKALYKAKESGRNRVEMYMNS